MPSRGAGLCGPIASEAHLLVRIYYGTAFWLGWLKRGRPVLGLPGAVLVCETVFCQKHIYLSIRQQ